MVVMVAAALAAVALRSLYVYKNASTTAYGILMELWSH